MASVRLKFGFPGHQVQMRHDTGRGDDVEMVTIPGASKSALHRWLQDGFIAGIAAAGAPWRVKINNALRGRIASKVSPASSVSAEAARALGSRQTVLDRVRRGELNAVHVNRGRRKGLAIEIPPSPQQLF